MEKPYTLHLGDCIEVMRTMPDNSCDSVVCDPPYELNFMNKGWDNTGIACRVDMWAEVLRVLKPGGHLLAFSGCRTYHRMAVAIEDAGFQIREMVGWMFGQGFPKSHNLKDEWQGWGTSLKPSFEPVCMARKPLIGTVAENVQRWGVGGINVDGCRIETDDNDIRSRPPRTPNSILGGGKGTNLTASEHNSLGRWPANLLHDGSDEVLAGFPETGSAKAARTAVRGGSAMFDSQTIGTPNKEGYWPADNGGSAARFFYCAKASKADRDEGLDGYWLDSLELIMHDGSTVKGEHLWVNQGQSLQADESGEASLQKDMSGATILLVDANALNMSLSGNENMGLFPQAIRFTTEMGTSKTIELQTSNYYQPLTIKESIAAAIKTGQEDGSSLVENAGLQKLLTVIFTKDKTGFPHGVKLAASRTPQSINVSDALLRKKNIHSTVKPTSLMRYLCRLVTPPGGIVLDPFCGSGSTGKAAMLEGFRFIGIDMTPEYYAIARARIEHAAQKPEQGDLL